MPRTKVSRKPKQSQDSLDGSDLLIKDFEKQTQLCLMKLDAEAKTSIKSLETFIDVEISRIPLEIREMNIGAILGFEYDNQKENYNEVSSSVNDNLLSVQKTAKGRKVTKRVTASDDGYVTESTGTVTRQSRARQTSTDVGFAKRTRSSSRNSKVKLSEINQMKTVIRGKGRLCIDESSNDADKFKTPALPKPSNLDYGIVTPKIKPNTPMNVLRRPRQGETVISMQGSPLLVSAVIQEKTANINVPLGNGNVMSLLPTEGLRVSHVPSLDPETMRQLETLKNHIEKVISKK